MTNIIEQLAEVAKDPEAYLNNVHLPEDAPQELRSDLLEILNRIPDGWGHWLSFNSGWYPLVVELNRLLRQIDPRYEVHQAKEKFGTLRYYIGLSHFPEAPCCLDFQKNSPGKPEVHSWKADDTKADEYEAAWEARTQAFVAHNETEEHQSYTRLRQPLVDQRHDTYTILEAVVSAFERKSAYTCELCGQRGSLHHQGYWLKTLCTECAEKQNYKKSEDD